MLKSKSATAVFCSDLSRGLPIPLTVKAKVHSMTHVSSPLSPPLRPFTHCLSHLSNQSSHPISPFLRHVPASGSLHMLLLLPAIILTRATTFLPPLPLSGHTCYLRKACPDLLFKTANILSGFPNSHLSLFIGFIIYLSAHTSQGRELCLLHPRT